MSAGVAALSSSNAICAGKSSGSELTHRAEQTACRKRSREIALELQPKVAAESVGTADPSVPTGGRSRATVVALIASATVETPAGPVSVSSVYAYPVALQPEHIDGFDPASLRLPSAKDVWPGDLVWWALRDWVPSSGRALLGGDWNTSRVLDHPTPRGNAEFFERMKRAGWGETARAFFPEEEAAATYARNPARPMQLDHFFASADLARTTTHFEVVRTDAFRDASDHAPILAEFDVPAVTAVAHATR